MTGEILLGCKACDDRDTKRWMIMKYLASQRAGAQGLICASITTQYSGVSVLTAYMETLRNQCSAETGKWGIPVAQDYGGCARSPRPTTLDRTGRGYTCTVHLMKGISHGKDQQGWRDLGPGFFEDVPIFRDDPAYKINIPNGLSQYEMR